MYLAAIGVAQVEVLVKRVATGEEKYLIFTKKSLASIDEIDFMPEIANSRGNRWLTTLTFDKTDPLKVIART